VVSADYLRFRQLRTTTLLREDISDDGLRSLVDMDMLHSDVLVTAMTQAAIENCFANVYFRANSGCRRSQMNRVDRAGMLVSWQISLSATPSTAMRSQIRSTSLRLYACR
jgi:hypothetical protein